jgi:asparagine N-glycosylation enzyme membrane subunit Stt3
VTAKPRNGFKLWAAFLSATFALLLFPNIVGRHGVWMSLFYTGLGVGFIWLLYFAVGRFIDWAVSEELKRQSREKQKDRPEGEQDPSAAGRE